MEEATHNTSATKSEDCCVHQRGVKRSAGSPTQPGKWGEGESSFRRRVTYIWSLELGDICDCLPRVPKRAGKVHSLIEAYWLLPFLHVVQPLVGNKDHLVAFHSQEYIDFLEFINDEEDSEKELEKKEEFGISYDCPSFLGLFDLVKIIVGASLRGVQALVSKECHVAINWTGGWHHGRRDEAAGFCYINDVVISLLKLKESFKRVLYIDLDLHHGDAVQDAFAHTPSIMTVSFHKYSPGFYPGTGGVEDVGHSRGRYYSVNVPLQDGITDAVYFTVFKRVTAEVYKTYQPSVVVLQCGVDTLVGDSMNSFNLTLSGVGVCLDYILSWDLPTLLLGGGGYNTPNTARCWTYLTAVALGVRLKSEIPDHQFFLDYGPDYQLEISQSNRRNLNTAEYLKSIISTISKNLKQLQPVSAEK